ncbi:arginase [Defluviitalea raffinosedens]|jgi:hypothetical protein|uniref:Arginase n=1 Tax=Defluviitalea raffinosedens TaxID=1450156 RepID=A0A7C8LS89_9FIRM|nr:arginase [Defluviitalea raffinosedens]KAE9631232.1 arginase [Defluviitalea raffinosedens]MBM7686231.1 hypothetical protein [Defluviitalea raffinosedens]MBZ4668675.1 arginase [Defluviitaleaceae bacterium]HHW68582.1 arginase [Candidatus Epulonipiscium sp.]
MEKCLLSIDWDYFIYSSKYYWGYYSENKKNLIDLWYKRYIQGKARGEDIQKAFHLSYEFYTFWSKIKKKFKFVKDIRVYVSDSHTMSYEIAHQNNCKTVYLFDFHADLGYGGFLSLDAEVNCSNWLGKLLKERLINKAVIFYSPHTIEKPEYFQSLNRIYNIRYYDFDNFNQCVVVAAIHICRSGTWTPPWFDDKFIQFIDGLGLSYEIVECPERKWDTAGISLSDQINYLLA